MFGALKWNNKFHNKKDLVKTEIFLLQCSLALVGTINWTSQMLSIWLLLCLNLYFDWWKQDYACAEKGWS